MIEEKDTVTLILEECISVHIERDIQYGGSYDNFTEIAIIATKLATSESDPRFFTALDVADCMIATKEARYKYALNHSDMKNHDKVVHDSLIDWINYIAIKENIRRIIHENNMNKDAHNGTKIT